MIDELDNAIAVVTSHMVAPPGAVPATLAVELPFIYRSLKKLAALQSIMRSDLVEEG